MDDAEISRRLALAIGYPPGDVFQNIAGGVSVRHSKSPQGYAITGWYGFDYRDPSVIWPIAEAYNCFPEKFMSGEWFARVPPKGLFGTADTAAKAVALAVIKAHEGSKP